MYYPVSCGPTDEYNLHQMEITRSIVNIRQDKATSSEID